MGKLIVIEGIDGSGKSTHVELLREKLEKTGSQCVKIKLPCYTDNSSALVKMYLNGEFGSHPQDVNAYAASSFFSVDRYASFKKHWGADYNSGKLILADRYTTSNAVHQMTKLKKENWDSYLDWLFDFEYNLMGIPAPDCVIFLDMPVDVSQKLMTKRYSGDENKKDVHERDIEYLLSCSEAARYACEKLGWNLIKCSENGEPRSIEAIAEDICNTVMKFI